jgi:sugar phosphate isomerase/epimerase
VCGAAPSAAGDYVERLLRLEDLAAWVPQLTGSTGWRAPTAGDPQVGGVRSPLARRGKSASRFTDRLMVMVRSKGHQTTRRGEPVRVPATRVALSTSSVYPESCADAFEIAARLGYDGVEVMVWTDPVSQDGAALARLSKHYGIPVLSVHAPTLLVTQRVWGKEPWPKLERSLQMADDLGASAVVAHPPFRWQKEYAAGFVEGVAELDTRFHAAMTVENMYPWRARNREMQAYLPGWDPVVQPYQNVTLDFSHASTAGGNSLSMARELGSRLTHVHLADGAGSAKDEHLVPGRGTQPCAEVLGLLAEWAWTGVVAVEVNTRKCRTREEREAELAECLAFARLHLAAPSLQPSPGR